MPLSFDVNGNKVPKRNELLSVTDCIAACNKHSDQSDVTCYIIYMQKAVLLRSN